jgi:dihydrofolate reductase
MARLAALCDVLLGGVMSKVFFSVTMSVDGFIAPEQRADDVDFKRWFAEWSELQAHVFAQRFFRQSLQLGAGGETGDDNRLLEEIFQRTGASIMGKRMFDGGEPHWPEDAPFHTPVFVLTHAERTPWERKGGTTFYFVNGIESALRQAREAAGPRDVRIAGGAKTIMQYLNAGLVDEFHLAVSPTFLGAGVRLFDGVECDRLKLDIVKTLHSPRVTHLMYGVHRRGDADTAQ